jgi:hypothetical protein
VGEWGLVHAAMAGGSDEDLLPIHLLVFIILISPSGFAEPGPFWQFFFLSFIPQILFAAYLYRDFSFSGLMSFGYYGKDIAIFEFMLQAHRLSRELGALSPDQSVSE